MRNFLHECYKIEQLAAKTYQQFAERMDYPENIRQIFQEMADDEMEHARIIDMVIQTPGHELVVTPGLSAGQVDEKLRLAKALLVSAEHSDLSADAALQLALDAEAQLVEVHANQSLIPGNPEMTDFFSTLTQYDCEHVDKLRACLDAS